MAKPGTDVNTKPKKGKGHKQQGAVSKGTGLLSFHVMHVVVKHCSSTNVSLL